VNGQRRNSVPKWAAEPKDDDVPTVRRAPTPIRRHSSGRIGWRRRKFPIGCLCLALIGLEDDVDFKVENLRPGAEPEPQQRFRCQQGEDRLRCRGCGRKGRAVVSIKWVRPGLITTASALGPLIAQLIGFAGTDRLRTRLRQKPGTTPRRPPRSVSRSGAAVSSRPYRRARRHWLRSTSVAYSRGTRC
jgi:hypothetical protein